MKIRTFCRKVFGLITSAPRSGNSDDDTIRMIGKFNHIMKLLYDSEPDLQNRIRLLKQAQLYVEYGLKKSVSTLVARTL